MPPEAAERRARAGEVVADLLAHAGADFMSASLLTRPALAFRPLRSWTFTPRRALRRSEAGVDEEVVQGRAGCRGVREAGF